MSLLDPKVAESVSARPGKVILITGGCQGLGREVGLQMAERKWHVAVADINAELGPEVVRELKQKGGEAIFLHVDVGSAEGPVEMVREAVKHFGRLDALVNCAAHAPAEGFDSMTAEAWESTLNVNVRGIALALSAAVEPMRKQGGGRIVNITSPASRMALPNYTAYAASKAAVDSLTRAAAVALARFNILVNSVAPGMMDTPLQLRTEEIFARLEKCDDVEAFRAQRTARIPLGRRTDCAEVAQAVVWLLTEAPPYIVAERLNISGGLDRD